ncbi:hypothetical protein KAR91_09525 [Candidatus Pacearchaeota archaeon]|nr:hypothetical protein [Candidatus Pacearchaeota archaeon]
MAGELGRLLRLLVQADKQAVITKLVPSHTPTLFTSQITENTRKGIGVYNNSDAGSGECYFGFDSVTMSPSGESMPIPQGSVWDIPIADTEDIPLYFHSEISGELNLDLRVIEVA